MPGHLRRLPRGGLRRRLALGLVLALGGCGVEPASDTATAVEEPAIVLEDAAPDPESPDPEVTERPTIERTPAPIEPTPAPDPEALALAREEAARAQFERDYPWYGVAYHFLAQVYARPDRDSPVVGYMRRGAQFRAQAPLRGPGCARGWHRVPGDGFVCRGEGYALGDTPQSFDPSPIGAALDDALPYAYAWVVSNDVPQYWRLPSREEEAQAVAWIERRRAAEGRAAEGRAARSANAQPAAEADGETPSETEEPDLEAPPGLDGDATEENVEAPIDAGVPRGPDAEDPQPSFLRMRMRRGFYVSIDRLETLDGRRFYRTIRGGYVPADAVAEASPPTMRGVVLGGRWTLPLGFVYRGGVRSLTRNPARGVLELAEPIERLTPMPLQEEVITRAGRRYRVGDRGRIVREDALRIAQPIERPERVPEDARWVHVDLAAQVLIAYEGDHPVFATLVSTGRAQYATPTGTFRIQSKHTSTTMDDPDGGEEAYSIEDVPWTMYFEGSYALHGAFWHDRFGHVRSHGCVNLAPADARWVFQWSAPAVPSAWHGVSAVGGRQGTWVHITE